MQGPVLRLDLPCHLAVHRYHSGQHVPQAHTQRPEAGQYALLLATDHALVRGIDQQQVDPGMARQGLAQHRGGKPHHPGQPLHRSGNTPAALRRQTAAGQLIHKQIAGVHAPQHLITLAPGTGGKQTGCLSQAVADHRPGAHPECRQDIAEEHPQGNLDKQDIPLADPALRIRPPETAVTELPAQVVILPVLTLQHRGEGGAQGPAHVGKVITKTREHEGQLPCAPGPGGIPALPGAQRPALANGLLHPGRGRLQSGLVSSQQGTAMRTGAGPRRGRGKMQPGELPDQGLPAVRSKQEQAQRGRGGKAAGLDRRRLLLLQSHNPQIAGHTGSADHRLPGAAGAVPQPVAHPAL